MGRVITASEFRIEQLEKEVERLSKNQDIIIEYLKITNAAFGELGGSKD